MELSGPPPISDSRHKLCQVGRFLPHQGNATYKTGCGTPRRICVELRAGLSGARQGIDTGICLAYASAYAR